MNQVKKIQHLYHRAGFGLSPQEWQERRNWPLDKAVKELFDKETTLLYQNYSMPPKRKGLDIEALQDRREKERELVQLQNINWVNRMADPSEHALLERMCLFWHGHFACKTTFARLAAQQINSIRKHALGHFRDLIIAIAQDSSMIRYLNNQQNRKKKPNENFARELLELFTIGHGNYTEDDVKEAARAFTGWASNQQGEYEFQGKHHDFDKKTFMGKSGNFNGDDIIDIVLEKKETALFIVRKIYRYFINLQVNEQRVAELADRFYQSNYDIRQLMMEIFKSNWFYEEENVGTKIKSPIELIAGLLRQLSGRISQPKGIIGLEYALGQVLFHPPNVAGWPEGKNWIDNATLILRLKLGETIVHKADLDFTLKDEAENPVPKKLQRLELDTDLQPILNLCREKTGSEVVKTLTDFFIQPTTVLPKDILTGTTIREVRNKHIIQLSTLLICLPEYQLC